MSSQHLHVPGELLQIQVDKLTKKIDSKNSLIKDDEVQEKAAHI